MYIPAEKSKQASTTVTDLISGVNEMCLPAQSCT